MKKKEIAEHIRGRICRLEEVDDDALRFGWGRCLQLVFKDKGETVTDNGDKQLGETASSIFSEEEGIVSELGGVYTKHVSENSCDNSNTGVAVIVVSLQETKLATNKADTTLGTMQEVQGMVEEVGAKEGRKVAVKQEEVNKGEVVRQSSRLRRVPKWMEDYV
ncbi:hypothetical protein DITRI_Ditri12bG0008000 [Diplodiscus trichospermus]